MVRQRFTRVIPGSFNDEAYLEAYRNEGKFPRIHDDIAKVVADYAPEHEPAMDIGACTGILALRLLALGRSNVYAVEGNDFDYARMQEWESDTFHCIKCFVDRPHMRFLEKRIRDSGITLLTARRVISEVGIPDVAVVREFAAMLKAAGVKKVILEGRAPVPHPIVALHNSDLEAEQFLGSFTIAASYKGVRYLEVQQ